MKKYPVLIGVGQSIYPADDYSAAPSPLESMHQVTLKAAEDACLTPQQLENLDAIGMMETILWSPKNGPDLLAESLNIKRCKHISMRTGGQTPVTLLNLFARDIAEGRSEFALLVGTNNLHTLNQSKADLNWPTGGSGAPEIIGLPNWGNSPLEAEYGMNEATTVYPMIENALRAERGLSLSTHIDAVANLMSPFTRIAAGNPYAWFPTERSAKEIATVSRANRMITYPYTKYLNAVISTNQSAAVIICSIEKAIQLGVPEQQWVYWRGGDQAREKIWHFSDRASFTKCKAMGDAASNALSEAGCLTDNISVFDFYSCFPSAIEMACKELGIAEDDPRDFTVTGGLPYAGGPGNNYALHSIAAMAQRVRSSQNTKEHTGLVTGNGWYMTKHAAAVLSSEPPIKPYKPASNGVQDKINTPANTIPGEALATRPVNDKQSTIETYTVTFHRDGTPARGIVVGHTSEGQRFVANTPNDRDLLETFCETEQVGCVGKVSSEQSSSGIEKNLFEPNG